MRYGLLIALGLGGAYQYIQTIGVQCAHYCAQMHEGILSASIDAPYRYRLLSALVYLALVAVFALWHEVRLLLPLLVFTLPVSLSSAGRTESSPAQLRSDP